jgi:hypothetical protein
MADTDVEDDASIDDDVLLWRRVHPAQVVFNENLNSYRPSSQAFCNTTGTTGMSVNISNETTIEDTLKGYEDHGLVSFETRLARQLGQGAVRKPLPDNSAHAEVTGNKSKSVRKKFSIGCSWIVNPSDN